MRKLSKEEKAFVKALLKMYYVNEWCKPSEWDVYCMMKSDIDRDILEVFIDDEWNKLIEG